MIPQANGEMTEFQYYFVQREAMETIIYLYDVAGVKDKGDIEKLFTMWDQWGWHRVTAYGDLKQPVLELADAMGYKVVEEA